MAVVQVVVVPAGGEPITLEPLLDSLRWTSAAVGGFGDASFSLPGIVRLPHLAHVQIVYDSAIVWEGRIEDATLAIAGDTVSSAYTGFGYRRLLEDTSVRRIWSKRDLDWQAVQIAQGTDGTNTLAKRGDLYAVATGAFDSSDQSLVGIEIRGAQNAGTAAAGDCHQAEYIAPSGLTLTRVMLDYDVVGTNHAICVHDSVDGVTWNRLAGPSTGTGSINVACTAGATMIRLTFEATGAQAITTTIRGRFTNIRLLGTSLTEDAAGGFYGGTILRDVAALVTGLGLGIVDVGSDYTIRAIERATRDSALAVVEEVAGYYTRQWAVWEGPELTWRTLDLDAPDLIVEVEKLTSLSLTGSIDGIARTVYVAYTDAASGRGAEATATATAQANPYVRQAKTKDLVVSGAAATSAEAAQVAALTAAAKGGWVPARGQIVLPLTAQIATADGRGAPAAQIRAGRTILLRGLAKDDLFAQGRDGQTLFHILSAETDGAEQTVTLELESQDIRADVQLARLAATR